ncbi:hypothetical protein GCM10027213_16830 [Mycobacterium bourgelatii]
MVVVGTAAAARAERTVASRFSRLVTASATASGATITNDIAPSRADQAVHTAGVLGMVAIYARALARIDDAVTQLFVQTTARGR